MVLHRIPLSEKLQGKVAEPLGPQWKGRFFFLGIRRGMVWQNLYTLYVDFMIGYLTAAAATRGGITQ